MMSDGMSYIGISKYILMVLLFLSLFSCDKLLNNNDESPPEKPIIEIVAESKIVAIGAKQLISASISGLPDSVTTTTNWSVSAGTFIKNSESLIEWTAPTDTMQVEISAVVKTSGGAEDSAKTTISVGNTPPDITLFSATANHVLFGNPISLSAEANDPEGFDLSYTFEVSPDAGTLRHDDPTTGSASWTAPPFVSDIATPFRFIVKATDNLGASTRDTLKVLAYSEFKSLWTVDSGSRKLVKYTANGDKILESEAAFQKPVAVTNDVEDFYGCYVADFDGAQVYKIDAEGKVIANFANIPTVIDLAMHQDTRTVWALSVSENAAILIDGFQNTELKRIYGFRQPRWITINQASGDVWISEQGNNRLIKLNANDAPASQPDTITYANTLIFPDSGAASYFNSPFQPFVKNQNAQTVYIPDRDDREIERFVWSNGSYVRSEFPVRLTGASPRAVTVTAIGGVFDVALIITFDGRLFAFPTSNPQNLTEVSGDYTFQAPHAIIADENTGECWIGDNGTNQWVKIRLKPDFTFETIRTLNGFVFIEDAVINK